MHSTRMKTFPHLFLLMTVLLLSLFFTVYSDSISEYAANTLFLCAVSVIPSLFPFMVLSSIASKAAAVLTKGTSSSASTLIPIFLGALCGFPVGASTVASMYLNGALTKKKAEYLCALCNNTGPAYLISVVGTVFWKNSSIGILFYVCQIISAFAVFIFCRIFHKIKKSSDPYNSGISVSDNKPLSDKKISPKSLCHTFCSSVTDSALSVIKICGYIVFFKVMCDSLILLLPNTILSRYIHAVVSCILEFTSGARAAANIGGVVGIALCGFSIGFSGLSVMAQSTGILSAAGLSSFPLLKLKFFSGLLSAILSATAYKYINITEPVFMYHPSVRLCFSSMITVILLFLFLVSAVFCAVSQRKFLPKS